MDFSKYIKAKRYIQKCNSVWGRDFLHDAYVAWFNKTGKDIFDENIYTILTVLRFILSHHREKLIIRKGDQTFPKRFFNVVSDYSNASDLNDGNEYNTEKEYVLRSSTPTIDVILEGLELVREFTESLSPEEHDLLVRLEQGLSSRVIAKFTGVPYSIVRKLHNAIKLKYQMLNNPINGSKLKITKQISLGTWEKKIDREDYDYEDGNEFYALYKHKESKDGLLVKIPAAKTNPYIK